MTPLVVVVISNLWRRRCHSRRRPAHLGRLRWRVLAAQGSWFASYGTPRMLVPRCGRSSSLDSEEKRVYFTFGTTHESYPMSCELSILGLNDNRTQASLFRVYIYLRRNIHLENWGRPCSLGTKTVKYKWPLLSTEALIYYFKFPLYISKSTITKRYFNLEFVVLKPLESSF